MTGETFVIAGASLAGAKAAEALRHQGFTGRIVLVGQETELPYERPPLSKGFLTGRTTLDRLYVHPRSWYAQNAIELRLGTAATSLDLAARRVQLSDGTALDYDKLLITTGSSPRELRVPGAGLSGVHTLRTISDSERIRTAIADGGPLAIIGAGWIGLETAAAAREAGVSVTVIEAAELPLLRVLGPKLATVFADLHREHGVDLRLSTGITEITGSDGSVTGVRLVDGTQISASAVLVGVGVQPNTALAESAGLRIDNGIRTDAQLRTSDPDVFAAGDVASAFHPRYGRGVRVEHWANALNQPKVAAAAMLGGTEVYDRLPYFYTDQYDLGMEYSGLALPGEYDQVITRGDVAGRQFVAFWVTGNQVLAGMSVNVWDVTEPIQDLIRGRAQVDLAALADPSVPLRELASPDPGR